MAGKFVFLVLARNKFEGPWKGLSVHVGKIAARHESEKLKIMWDEIKVLKVYDFEAAQYFRPQE